MARQQRAQSFTATVDGQTHHWRSKLEFRWATYLGVLRRGGEIQSWDFEPRTFLFFPPHIPKGLKGKAFGVRRYKVDFKVVEKDGMVTWHETKGYLTPKDTSKMRCMEMYYPDETLWLVFDGIPKPTTVKKANALAAIQKAEKYVDRVYDARHDFKRLGI